MPENSMSTSPPATPPGNSLPWYMMGQGSWFLSLGLQFVLFPHLVAQVLGESGTKVGLALMSLQIPAIAFMLLGGAVAERSNIRTILLLVHLLGCIPALALGTVLATGAFTYTILIVYALAMGTLGAFAIPARDSALSRVAGSNIQRAVTLAMGVQLSAQLTGMLLAGLAGISGLAPLFFLQAAIMATGFYAVYRLHPLQPLHQNTTRNNLREIGEGLREVIHSPALLPVIMLIFAIGLFYVSSFLVVIPLMIRDIYQGGVEAFAFVNICFWSGTIIATLALLKIGHIRYRGRVLLVSITSGCLLLTGFSFPVPYWTFCIMIFCWGLGAGTTMTLSRTIVQTEAPESHRARILAIYQLGFNGGAPLGALAMGFLVDWLGPHTSFLVPGSIMMLVIAALVAGTRLASMETPPPERKPGGTEEPEEKPKIS